MIDTEVSKIKEEKLAWECISFEILCTFIWEPSRSREFLFIHIYIIYIDNLRDEIWPVVLVKTGEFVELRLK